MKLSETQRAILADALDCDDPDWFLDSCVYKRNLHGLVNAGAIDQDNNDRWFVTGAARAEMDGAS
jgi:hypothetical protein